MGYACVNNGLDNGLATRDYLNHDVQIHLQRYVSLGLNQLSDARKCVSRKRRVKFRMMIISQ